KYRFTIVYLIPQFSGTSNSVEMGVGAGVAADSHTFHNQYLQLRPCNKPGPANVIGYYKKGCGEVVFFESGARVFKLGFPPIVERDYHWQCRQFVTFFK